ncbi:MAG TPA: ribosome biogenesis GTPase YlqF [Candidatus Scatomonas merdavium]|nr:ribosome biogenesis GTPase YlqF [Candidatus Scatomonas merdavium]
MEIQWYPGHMTKARRQMQEDMKLIDLIIELVDARIPGASRNPDIDELGRQKSRLILLNKADLADEKQNQRWLEYWKGQGYYALLVNSRDKATLRQIQPLVAEACREKLERDARRGIKNRPVRAMVAGIPNVGKSTFINSYAGKACTKTGNRPGVTKGKQWIRMGKGLELLDTPGILWPKFEDPEVGKKLALIGSVKDEILNGEELALALIAFLAEAYPGVLAERYSLEEKLDPVTVLKQIAENRKCLTKGGEFSCEKAAAALLDDFRSGKLGRISLEVPPQSDRT